MKEDSESQVAGPLAWLTGADEDFVLQRHRVLCSTAFDKARLSPAYFARISPCSVESHTHPKERRVSKHHRTSSPRDAASRKGEKAPCGTCTLDNPSQGTASSPQLGPPQTGRSVLEEGPPGSTFQAPPDPGTQPRSTPKSLPSLIEAKSSLPSRVNGRRPIPVHIPGTFPTTSIHERRQNGRRTAEGGRRRQQVNEHPMRRSHHVGAVRFTEPAPTAIKPSNRGQVGEKEYLKLGRLFRREEPIDSALDTMSGTLHDIERREWSRRRSATDVDDGGDLRSGHPGGGDNIWRSWKTLNQAEFINHVMTQVTLPDTLKRRLHAWDRPDVAVPPASSTLAPTSATHRTSDEHLTPSTSLRGLTQRPRAPEGYSTAGQYTFVRRLAQSVVKADPEEFMTLYESIPANLSFRHLEVIKDLTRRIIDSNGSGDNDHNNYPFQHRPASRAAPCAAPALAVTDSTSS